MIECPKCGFYISGLESECDICGHQIDWEDYYDYDSIATDHIDEILKFNSIEVADVVRQEKQLKPRISIKIFYCPACGAIMLPKSNSILCDICEYKGYLILDPESLWQEVLNEHVHYPLAFIEKHELDNFWHCCGKEYYVTAEFDKALLCFDKAIELNQSNGDAWFYKMSIYDGLDDEMNMKRCRKIMFKCYNDLLKSNPKDDRIWNKKGLAFYRTGQFKRAIECFSKAIKYDPNNHHYWNNKGDCYYYHGDDDLALECFDNAIDLNEFSSYAWLSKAHIFKEQENHELMLACFDKVIEINQNNKSQWPYHDVYYADDENLMEYVMKCDKEMGKYFNYISTLKNKGDFYYSMKDFGKAKFYYGKLLEFDYDNEALIELLEELDWEIHML